MPEVIIDGVRYEPAPTRADALPPHELRELRAWRTYSGFDRTALLSALENRGELPPLDDRIPMTSGHLISLLVNSDLRRFYAPPPPPDPDPDDEPEPTPDSDAA